MDDNESDTDEAVPFLGTQLEPKISLSQPVREPRKARPVPIHEQRVLDERGRPLRFHGAFTGGFSAGHFNTVADAEGFTPGTFVSRRRKAEAGDSSHNRKRQRPEDFMDSEDFSEFGIAPRTLHTGVDYSDSTNKSSGDLLREIVCPIRPIRLPIAVKLMRRFGWKEGQGVGATRAVKDTQDSERNDDDTLFATPVDIPAIRFVVKANTFGLGYSGLDPYKALFQPAPKSNDMLQSVSIGGTRRGIRGQAFGVSALEEDDDDIFAADDMAKYDWSIGGPADEEDFHGWTAPKAKKNEKKPLGYVGKILSGFRLGETSQISVKERFPRPFLPAWYVPVRGANSGLLKEPTEVGPDASQEPDSEAGNSIFDFISREDRLRLERARQRVNEQSSASGKDSSSVSGVLLQNIRVPQTSIQGSREDRRSRWDAKPQDVVGTEAVKLEPSTPASEAKAQESCPSKAEVSRPKPSLSVGFQPFETNTEKQKRYEEFSRLFHSRPPHEAYRSVAPQHFTEWERQREQEEFMQVARIKKPLAGILASRFHKGEEINLDVTCRTGNVIHGSSMDSRSSAAMTTEPEPISEQEKAVQEKRYGVLTRRTLKWHPHRIVCRRFNVPEPYPDSDIVGLEERARQRRDKFSIFDFLNMTAQGHESVGTAGSTESTQMELVPPDPKVRNEKKKSIFSVLFEEENAAQTSTEASTSQSVCDSSEKTGIAPTADEVEVSTGIDSNSRLETEEQQRNTQEEVKTEVEEEENPISMDIFKAIFADSESSDEEEEEAEEEETKFENVVEDRKVERISSEKPKEARPNVAPSKMMAASSLFRHLFEEEEEESEKRETTKETATVAGQSNCAEQSKSYGPDLPPDLPSSTQTLTCNEFLLRVAAKDFPVDQEDDETGSNEKKRHKSKKSHKTKKSKKKKEKGKKKKKKRGRDSSDSNDT